MTFYVIFISYNNTNPACLPHVRHLCHWWNVLRLYVTYLIRSVINHRDTGTCKYWRIFCSKIRNLLCLVHLFNLYKHCSPESIVLCLFSALLKRAKFQHNHVGILWNETNNEKKFGISLFNMFKYKYQGCLVGDSIHKKVFLQWWFWIASKCTLCVQFVKQERKQN